VGKGGKKKEEMRSGSGKEPNIDRKQEKRPPGPAFPSLSTLFPRSRESKKKKKKARLIFRETYSN
jgi:hypothetical protein